MTTTGALIPAGKSLRDIAWNVVGQTYMPKLHSEHAFVWHGVAPADTFVPPHIHTHQDEWFFILDGMLEVEMQGKVMKVGKGGTIHMPKGEAHAIFNRSGATAEALFGVAPARGLFDLFSALDGVDDPAELVRLSALHEVNFLPPPNPA